MNGSFSFSRESDGKPVAPILEGEKVVGKVAIVYESGCRKAEYKELSLGERVAVLQKLQSEKENEGKSGPKKEVQYGK